MATSDFNFRAITLPGIGELTAHSLGTQSVFNANTPTTWYQDAMDRLGLFYQQGGRGVTNPRNEAPWRPGMPVPPGYRVTTIRGRQVLIPIGEGQAVPQSPPLIPEEPTPDLRDLYPGIPLPPRGGVEGIPEGAPGGRVDPSNKGIIPDPVGSIRSWLEETDAVTRGIMVLIAIVLLAIGIISLR